MKALPSNNPLHGLWGNLPFENRPSMWALLSRRARNCGLTAEQARDFLDSVFGRHLADDYSRQTLGCLGYVPRYVTQWKKAERKEVQHGW